MVRYYVWIDKRVQAGKVIGAGIELPDGLDNAERDKLCFALINEILVKEIAVGWRELKEDEAWPIPLSDKYGIKKEILRSK